MGVILGASKNFNFNTLYPWVSSALATKNKVVMILMENNKTLEMQLRGLGVEVVVDPISNTVVPHHERFRIQYEYLMNCDEEYTVVTDSRDVLFQTDPVEWMKSNLGSHSIVCSSEGLAYKNEFWGNQNLQEGFPYLYETHKENTIMNVGVLGGKTKAIAELSLMIYTMCKHNPARVSDQSSFNVLCGMKILDSVILKARSDAGWALHAGTWCKTNNFHVFQPNLLEPLPQLEDKVAKTHDGKTYSILHQYDRIVSK
jgi:hypothetical protein